MTRFRIETLVPVQKLNPARRSVLLKRMRSKLEALSGPEFDALRARIAAALTLQHEALALVQQRRTSNEAAMHADGAKELDSKLDRLLTLFNANLSGFIDLFGGAQAAHAMKVREAVFRDGVSSITGRPFTEQHELINLILHDLRKADLQAALAALGLLSFVGKLDELNAAYGQRLTRSDRIDPEIVRAVDTKAWISLVEVVSAIVAIYPTNADAHVAGRAYLLQPLVDQEEEAALLRARRRSGTPDGKRPADDSDEDMLDEDMPPAEAAEAAPSA